MYQSTTLDGDLSLGRNLHAGGNANIQGALSVGQNLKVRGWLDAPNIIGQCKGLFNSPEALSQAHPKPQLGSFAIVGHTVPGALYVFRDGEWQDTGQTAGEFDLQLDGLLADMADLKAETLDALEKFAVSNSALADLYGRTIEWESGIYNSNLEPVPNGSYSRAKIDVEGAAKVEFYASLVTSRAYLVDADNAILHVFLPEGAKEYSADMAGFPGAKWLYVNNYRAGSEGLPLSECWVKLHPAAPLRVAETQAAHGAQIAINTAAIADQERQVASVQDGLGGRVEVLNPPLYEDGEGDQGYYLRLSGGRVYVTKSDYRRFTQPIHLEPGETIVVKSVFQSGVCPIAIVSGGEYLPVGVAEDGISRHRANSPIDVAVSFDATCQWEIVKIGACFSYQFEVETQRRNDRETANLRVFNGQADEWVYCPMLKGCAYRVRVNNGNRNFYGSPEKMDGIPGAFSLLIVNGEQMVRPNSDIFFIRCNVSMIAVETVPFDSLPATKPLYIGALTLGSINPTAGVGVVQPSAVSACMADYCAMPFAGLKCHIRLPDGWKCTGYGSPDNPRDGVASYRAATAGDQKLLQNGDIAVFPAGARMYRFAFAKADGGEVDLAETQAMVDDGRISVSYEADDIGVMARNAHKEALVAAAMGRDSMSSNANVGGADSHGLFTMLHITDLHGDALRYANALEYADRAGVDLVVMTGDYCMDLASDGMGYLGRLARACRTPILSCVGNHDTALARAASMPTCPAADQVQRVIAPFVGLGSIPAGTDKTYYCRDITFRDAPTVAYYYRVIALNTYEGPRWDKPYISKEQIDWLIATLSGVPDKYGVIILMHNVENPEATTNQGLVAAPEAANFMQVRRRNKTAGIVGMPISAIVDAWQSRASISGSYTNAGEAQPTAYEANFADVPAGAEFICFMCGHEHMDLVGYNPGTTNRQAVLGLCSGSGAPITGSASVTTGFARSGDLPRRGDDATQDAFNIVAVDRQNRRLKIVRIGADTNVDFQKRDCAIMPYA